MYPSQWKINDKNEGGKAEYKVEGLIFTLHLNSYFDYAQISHMLDLAFEAGKDFERNRICDQIQNVLNSNKI